MKDPINEHNNHQNKMDEIFGKIAKFFSSSNDKDQKQGITRTPWIAYYKGKPIGKHKPSKEQLDAQTDDFHNRIEKHRIRSSNNDDFSVASLGPEAISINTNQIRNYQILYVENTSNGKGMGSFRRINYNDFKNYDVKADIYGIAWLFDKNASYDADIIYGKLYANKRNQSVNFKGQWIKGKFYGKLVGKKISVSKGVTNKNLLLQKFENLKKYLIQTINVFNTEMKSHNFQDLTKKYAKNNEVLSLIEELNEIKKELDTMQNTGFAGKSYISSNELKDIRSMIDKNHDQDDILEQINKFFASLKSITLRYTKAFKALDDQINNNKNKPNTSAKKLKI